MPQVREFVDACRRSSGRKTLDADTPRALSILGVEWPECFDQIAFAEVCGHAGIIYLVDHAAVLMQIDQPCWAMSASGVLFQQT